MEQIDLVIKISREAYEIMKYNNTVNNPVCPLSQETMVRKIAEGVPEPKNPIFKHIKKGSWVWKPKGYNLLGEYLGDWHCSNCHRVLDKNVSSSFIEHAINYSYCPYCGNTTEAIETESEDSD